MQRMRMTTVERRRMLHLAIITTILALSIGIAPEAHAAPVRVMAGPYDKVTFVASKGVNMTLTPKEPIGVTNTFTILDDMVFLFIKFENLTGAHRLTLKAFDPQGLSFGEQDYELKDPGSGYHWIWILRYWNVGEPFKMAVGEWRAEADLDGLFVTSLKFTIQAPKPSTFCGCRVEVKDYKCDEKNRISSPMTLNMTTDKMAYFFFIMGTVRGKVPVTWRFFDPNGKIWSENAYDMGVNYWWTWSFELGGDKGMFPGSWTAEAYAGGKSIARLEFVIYPRIPHLVLARPVEVLKPETLYPGDTITLKYTLKNDGGTTAKNVQLKVSKLQGLTLLNQTVKDLPAGSSDEWIIKIRADEPGNYTFTVQPLMTGQEYSVLEYSVLVSEKPFLEQYGLYIGIAAVIAIILVAVLVLMRRRKPSVPPAQPVTTAPIGVAQQVPTQRFCVACGAPLAADEQFCGKCGARQT